VLWEATNTQSQAPVLVGRVGGERALQLAAALLERAEKAVTTAAARC